MNPSGTAFSDVWYIGDDLQKENYYENKKILNIIQKLSGEDNKINVVNSTQIYDDTELNNELSNNII